MVALVNASTLGRAFGQGAAKDIFKAGGKAVSHSADDLAAAVTKGLGDDIARVGKAFSDDVAKHGSDSARALMNDAFSSSQLKRTLNKHVNTPFKKGAVAAGGATGLLTAGGLIGASLSGGGAARSGNSGSGESPAPSPNTTDPDNPGNNSNHDMDISSTHDYTEAGQRLYLEVQEMLQRAADELVTPQGPEGERKLSTKGYIAVGASVGACVLVLLITKRRRSAVSPVERGGSLWG